MDVERCTPEDELQELRALLWPAPTDDPGLSQQDVVAAGRAAFAWRSVLADIRQLGGEDPRAAGRGAVADVQAAARDDVLRCVCAVRRPQTGPRCSARACRLRHRSDGSRQR
jgi:hypothetical protein